jgi:RNA polymerase sigma factor (sigma-70 family)
MSQSTIRNYLRAAVGVDSAASSDADLLTRFATSRDESAFELVVWRHAALVQRICKAVLRDHHAAEDAAQATFLALARQAHKFAGCGSVVGWLYQVARRASVKLAKKRARSPVLSTELDRAQAATEEIGVLPDEVAVVCEEIDRLPERYRLPVLLCYFEGLTHEEAARRTGCPVGTIAGRLARAKELLAERLSRKGIGLPVLALALPAGSFVGSTAQAAVAFATRSAVVPGVAPSVVSLAEGVLKAMIPIKQAMAATAAIVLCALGTWAFSTAATPQAPSEPLAVAPPTTPAKPVADPRPTPDAKAADARERASDPKQRIVSINNLKQIVLAIHNYAAAYDHLPQDICDKDGKPLLSWRVAILPYIEGDQLYKEFKLDEPWDSKNNKKLLAKMPAVLRAGFDPKDTTKTYYQAFAGPGTVFEPGRQVKFTDITDGTSQTLAVVEAGPAVEWTKPADILYDPKKAIPNLEGPFKDVFIAATADGAVHTLDRSLLDETNLRDLIERADGHPIEFDKLHAKLPLTKEELKAAQDLLKENEKLITAIAEQLREQQKILVTAGKKRNPDDPIKGIDVQRLVRMQGELEMALAAIKKETEELRKQLEEK